MLVSKVEKFNVIIIIFIFLKSKKHEHQPKSDTKISPQRAEESHKGTKNPIQKNTFSTEDGGESTD